MYNIELSINFKKHKNSIYISNKYHLKISLKAFSMLNKKGLNYKFKCFSYNKYITFIFNKGYNVIWLFEYPWLFN